MPIRLVVSDVDGTLVTKEKAVTPATIEAARRLRDAGIHLALVSSRPPRGMAFLTMDLGLTGPMGGFNGATILAPDGAAIEEQLVPGTGRARKPGAVCPARCRTLAVRGQ